MAGAPKYSKGEAFMKRMADAERRHRNENIMVRNGEGRYPECVFEKSYNFCPEEKPANPKNVPQDCKHCPHFLNSKFYSEVFMTHEKRLEMWKKRDLPLLLESVKH